MAYKNDITEADKASEALDFPEIVLIDNCNMCNLKCSICDHKNIGQYRKIQVMDIRLHNKIIDEISVSNRHARVWEIFFGDPFLCKDMSERISYAKKNGLSDVVLNSNGIFMTADKAEKIIRAGLDAMYVGVDALTRETYEKIRTGGELEKVIKNVRAYRDILKRVGRPEQKIFVQFVLTDVNEHELEDFKNFWLKEGVEVKIRPKVSWAGLIGTKNLINNDLLIRKPCYWLMKSISICADGQVALCAVDVHCRVNCGNVRKSSVKDVWNGILRTYRLTHQDNRYYDMPKMCSKCRDWQSAYAEYVKIP